MRRRLKNSRVGMTLVEIMVVITIIVSLMAILAVNVLGSLDAANQDQTRIVMGQISQSLQMYALKHKGKFPSTSDGLEAAAKYMPNPGEIPTDAWGNEFQYFSPGTHSSNPFELVSLGKDGQEGGEDYAADIRSWEDPEED